MEKKKRILLLLVVTMVLLLSISTVVATNSMESTVNKEETIPQIETNNSQNQVNTNMHTINTNQVSQTNSIETKTQVNIENTTKISDKTIKTSNIQKEIIQTNTQNPKTDNVNTQITETNKKQQESDPQSITPTQTITKKVTEKQNTTQIQTLNTQIAKTSLKTIKQASGNTVNDYAALMDEVNTAKSSGDTSYTINLNAANTYTITSSITWGSSTGTLRNLTINGNGATIDGQGTNYFISVSNGYTLNLINVTIKNTKSTGSSTSSDSTRDGSVVYNQGNLTVTDCNLINNTGRRGGAISNLGNINITNTTINDDVSVGLGGAIYSSGNLEINNATFKNNTDINTNALSGGGAIYSTGNLTIYNNTNIYNNSAAVDGGAIYNTGFLIINDTSIYNNTAHTSGAILSSGNLTVNNVKIYNNSASKTFAGAIYVNGKTLINNTQIYNNSAVTYGGAIYITSKGNLTVNNTNIYNNSAVTDGGAIYITASGNLTVNNTNIYNNSAGATGGAICSAGNLNIIQNATVYNNSAVNGGGAIYSTGNLTVNDTIFYNNKFNTTQTLKYGGAINTNGITVISNSTFHDNIANGTNDGGAVYAGSNADVTVKNTTFYNNIAYGNSGALKNNGNMTLNNVTMYNNTALNSVYANGGAINNQGNLTISNAFIYNNTAAKIGGAIYNEANINITNTTIYNNKLTSNNAGGAIYNIATMKLNNVTAYDNNATNGGAIANIANLTIGNSTFYKNNATNGGVLYNTGNSTINNTIFDNNTAVNGGIIYTTFNLTVSNSSFSNSTATDKGGAIVSTTTSANVTLSNNTFTNITATNETLNLPGINTFDTINPDIFTNCTIGFKTAALSPTSTINVNVGTNVTETIEFALTYPEYYDTNILDNVNYNVYVNGIQASTINKNEYNVTSDTAGTVTTYVIPTIANTASNTATLTFVTRDVTIKVPTINANATKNTPITVTLNETATNKGITSGNVTLVIDGVDVETKELSGTNEATFNYIFGDANTHTVSIRYNDTNNYYTNTTKDVSINLVTEDTTITVGVTNDAVVGKLSELNASIVDMTNLPVTSGNVTFYVNGQFVGTVELTGSNIAKLQYVFPSSGDYTIKAVYNDTNNEYTNNTSNEVTAQITTIPTNINVDVNPGTTTTNTTIKVNVTDNNGNLIKTGTVTIYDNGNVIGTVDVTNGEIKLNKILNQSGNHNITATYNDNTGVYASSNTSVFIDISKTGVVVVVPSVDGTIGNVTLNATIIDVNGKNVNDGVVLFYVNGSYVGLANVTNSIASINTTLDNIGIFNITTVYNGTSVYDNQTGNGTIVVGNKLNTIIKVNSVFSMVGSVTQLQANITDENGNLVNGGRVVFKVNGKVLRDVNGNVIYVNVVDGKALLNYTCPVSWSKANVTITAVYGGTDNKYNSSRSTNANVTVIKRTAIINLIVTHSPVRAEDTTQFLAIIRDVNGTILNNGVVIFKFQGHTIKDVNNNTVLVNVTNGQAMLSYTIFDGISAHGYNISAVYSDPAYYRAEAKAPIMVEKTNTKITVDTVTGIPGQNVTVTGIIKDIHGNIVQGTNRISIKLNGKTILSNVTVTNGIINENITIPDGLKQNTYNITIVTGARLAYNAGTGVGILINNKITNLNTLKQEA